jgi:hypothetical protein
MTHHDVICVSLIMTHKYDSSYLIPFVPICYNAYYIFALPINESSWLINDSYDISNDSSLTLVMTHPIMSHSVQSAVFSFGQASFLVHCDESFIQAMTSFYYESSQWVIWLISMTHFRSHSNGLIADDSFYPSCTYFILYNPPV